MNILVLGGLFLLGMVAVVVAVLLVMSERGNESGAALAAAVPTAAMPAPSAPAPSPAVATGRPTKRLTVPLQAAETEAGNTKAPPLASQSLPTMPGGNFVPAHEVDRHSTHLNGQVRELAAELRALHVRAGEIERRLSVLVEMVERIEHDYGGLVEVDLDEAEVSPDIPPGR